MKYSIVKLDDNNRQFLSEKIKTMEENIYYPLGEDHFKIDHGEDYFAFFERLGKLHYWCVFHEDKLIAVAAGVIRLIENKKTWYLCDLKVIEDYRGEGIPQYIFKKAFLYNCKKERVFRAYAVSMNSMDKKLPFHKIKRATLNLLKVKNTLRIYNFSKEDIVPLKKIDDFVLTNTKNKKDLVLKSDGSSVDLFHLTKNKELETSDIPNDDSLVMLSCFEGGYIDKMLVHFRKKHSSTATVLTFRANFIKNIFSDEI